MSVSFVTILVIHVLTGVVALTTGVIALISLKGSKNHRKSGVIFYYSMNIVAVTAIVMSVMHPSVFFLQIGLFTFYMNYMGKRAVKNKRMIPSRSDILVVILGVINTGFMLYMGNLITTVFAIISAFLVSTDIKVFYTTLRKRELRPQTWLVHHIGRMIGAYIATSTAFLVVNLPVFFIPRWIPWLAPSILGGILIAIYTNRVVNKRQRLA